MTTVLALDLSLTSSGYCYRDYQSDRVTGTLKAGDRRGPERMSWLRDEVMALEYESNAELVAIEGFSFGSKGRAVVDIGGLGWVVRTSLWDAGVPFVEVAPSLVKKYACGSGAANKDMVRDAARDRFDLPAGVSSDECDAIWLWALVSDACGTPTVTVPKGHREAVPKVAGLLDCDGEAA